MSWFPRTDKTLNECTYIINLQKRSDKRKAMEYKIHRMNLSSYKFFNAINGLDSKYDDLYEIVASSGSYTSRGAFGLLMTYIKLLENAYKNNYDRILILEDDVNFHKQYHDLLTKFSHIINDDRYDIVWLGANQRTFSKTQLDSIKKTSSYLPESYKHNYTYGTFSIMLNRSGIIKLLKIVNSRNILSLKSIDIIINELISSYVLRGIVCFPFLFMPDVSDSDNMGPRNQEQFSKTRRFVYNDYHYLSQQDISTISRTLTASENPQQLVELKQIEQKVLNDKNTQNTQNTQNAFARVCNFVSDPNDILKYLL